MECNYYTVVTPDTLTHYPDIHQHNVNIVLDIAIMKTNNIHYTIKNLNFLFSDHNPVLLDINNRSSQKSKNTYLLKPLSNDSS